MEKNMKMHCSRVELINLIYTLFSKNSNAHVLQTSIMLYDDMTLLIKDYFKTSSENGEKDELFLPLTILERDRLFLLFLCFYAMSLMDDYIPKSVSDMKRFLVNKYTEKEICFYLLFIVDLKRCRIGYVSYTDIIRNLVEEHKLEKSSKQHFFTCYISSEMLLYKNYMTLDREILLNEINSFLQNFGLDFEEQYLVDHIVQAKVVRCNPSDRCNPSGFPGLKTSV